MNDLPVSVILPTRDRASTLIETLHRLSHQNLAAGDFEIIVVDDGSHPPIHIIESTNGVKCRVVRLGGAGRSAARNVGAAAAGSNLLVFIDDDLTVGPEFLSYHQRAHREWPGALVVGAIRLGDLVLETPFGKFRDTLEQHEVPIARGLTAKRNLCTAANMSIDRARFQELGGFDPALHSAEDQDFALRHTQSGGRIAFIPEALAIHRDGAIDIRRDRKSVV